MKTPVPSFAQPFRPTLALRFAPVLAVALMASACSTRLDSFTGSIKEPGEAAAMAGPGGVPTATLTALGKRYDAKPGDKQASLSYAAALRANGQHPQAVAVLQRASVLNVGDRDVAAAYGKALADIGRFDEAKGVLVQAHSEDRPNWRVLSTLGSIADQQGDHPRARDFYHRAMQIAPDEPSILNNLGLSYLLTRELDKAEETLRRASTRQNADPRIQANLALAQQLRAGSGRAAPVSPARPVPVTTTPAPPPAATMAAPVAAAPVAPSPTPVAAAAARPLTAPPAQGAIRPKAGGLFGLTGRFRGEALDEPAAAPRD